MGSTSDTPDGEESGRDRPRERSDDGSAERSILCWVCQRPIERETPGEWRGEPVHVGCTAELRCGISLGPRADGG